MAFTGVLLVYAIWMTLLGMVGIGLLGLVLCPVCTVLYRRARQSDGKHQKLYLVLAVIGGAAIAIGLVGAGILALLAC